MVVKDEVSYLYFIDFYVNSCSITLPNRYTEGKDNEKFSYFLKFNYYRHPGTVINCKCRA